MTATICIGVPSYRRAGQLATLLQRLAPLVSARPHIRLCVVNDGSHDAAYERVMADFAEAADYRVSPRNGGCGAARRAAFEGATEDYLVCIDDDCMPSREWLDWLEALIEAHPSVDLFAGDVRPYFEREPGAWERALSIVDEGLSPVIFSDGLQTAVTANLAMKRTTYERAGGFSDDLRSTEDSDMTQRMIATGATYMVVAECWIYHVAKLTYRAVARRFYLYGFHAAEYALSRKSWRMGLYFGAGSLRQCFSRARSRYAIQRTEDAGDKSLSARAKFYRAFAVAALTFEFELGWRRAMRRAGVTDSKNLPQPPVLADRYVDFSAADATLFQTH